MMVRNRIDNILTATSDGWEADTMKQRIFVLILSALMIMSFVSCKKAEPGPVAPETTVQKVDGIKTIQLVTGSGGTHAFAGDTYDICIRETHPVVCVYYGDENKYPELSKALEDYNTSEKEHQLAFIEENKDDALEFYLGSGEGFYVFESTVTPYVRRADTLLTSILYEKFTYMGGIHGDTYLYGENYDTKTGKKLRLEDVVNDKTKLTEAISEQLDKHWGDIERNDFADLEELLYEERLISWTLDYNGITVYFMPLSIANYSTGIQVVTVSNKEYPEVLKDAYQVAPDSYGIELTKDTMFYYDVTGDGVIDEIVFSAYESDDEGNAGAISIYVNGTTYDEESWMYGAYATFVHTEDGKNYMYVEVSRESDYRQTICYDLSYGIKKIGEVDGALRRNYHAGEDNVITQDALTDPGSFYLEKTTQILSTVKGFKKYHTNETGIPQTDEQWFRFDEESAFTFTLLQDMEVDVYDEKGDKITGTKALKTGDKVIYTGTDGETYGLLKCQDGTVCRMEYRFDDEKARMTVNGMVIEEVFEGIMYAG